MFVVFCLTSLISVNSAEPDASVLKKAKAEGSAPEAHSERTILIDAPRPMSDMARILTARFGVPVTYEDPPFAAPDLRSILLNGSGLIPKNVFDAVTYPANAKLPQVLNSAVSVHNAGGHGGEFIVKAWDGGSGLIPSHYLGEDKQKHEHQSLLDKKISLTLKEADTCETVIKAVLAELQAGNPDATIVSGRFPVRLIAQVPYPIEKSHATSREFLNEILGLINAKLGNGKALFTWQFRYSPPNPNFKQMWNLEFQGIERRPSRDFALRIEAARPTASAVTILQKRFPDFVSFEEPLRICPCEVIGKFGSGNAGLAGGVIGIDWDTDENTVANILPLLMNAPIEPRDPAGMFDFAPAAGGGFHVFPAKARDATANVVACKPALNAIIDTESLKGSVSDVASQCAALALDVEKVQVDAQGDAVAKALRLPMSKAFELSAMPARDALNECLQSLDPKLAWQLQFDPAEGKHRLVIFAK